MNKRILLFITILMSVMTVWWLRSFFLPENLSRRLVSGNVSDYELSYAKATKLPAYYLYQRSGQVVGSALWLQATRALAESQAQYAIELAHYFQQQNNLPRAKFWLTHALTLNSEQAVWLLANIEYREKNYPAAAELLADLIAKQSAKYYEKSLLLLIEIRLIQGKLTKVSALSAKLEVFNPEHPLLGELSFYSVLAVNQGNAELANTCHASVQMYGTELSSLRKLSRLIAEFEQTPLQQFACFTTPRYISQAKLNCSHQGKETIRCDEKQWQTLESTIDTRFIGVMVPQGGANVNHGILYLDSEDSLSVFAHEIAHLLGFIDEYPLPKHHAKCDSAQSSPFAFNVAVFPKVLKGDRQTLRKQIIEQLAWGRFIKQQTPILTEVNGQWRLGTPGEYRDEVGLFNSKTCDKRQTNQGTKLYHLQAFKPLSSLTSLEYHELDFPEFYIQLLLQAPEQFLMPDFHRNIAIAQTAR